MRRDESYYIQARTLHCIVQLVLNSIDNRHCDQMAQGDHLIKSMVVLIVIIYAAQQKNISHQKICTIYHNCFTRLTCTALSLLTVFTRSPSLLTNMLLKPLLCFLDD